MISPNTMLHHVCLENNSIAVDQFLNLNTTGRGIYLQFVFICNSPIPSRRAQSRRYYFVKVPL